MTEEELELLRECYIRIPEVRKGYIKCIEFDPAGGIYEFTEAEWSKKVRELLGIRFEPTGI